MIPNPVFVKAEDYPKVKERRKAIVTVGRLHPQKNHKLLIDAFALVADQISDYTLEIYGDGELKDELQRHIDDLGLNNRVFLKGTSKEIHKLIYDAALFVLSSDYEGLPNTLLEAIALGIPSISTDCRPGGAREIIEDGINGRIVPIGSEKILATEILTVLSDTELTEKYSKNALISSRRFNTENIYNLWTDYILGIGN